MKRCPKERHIYSPATCSSCFIGLYPQQPFCHRSNALFCSSRTGVWALAVPHPLVRDTEGVSLADHSFCLLLHACLCQQANGGLPNSPAPRGVTSGPQNAPNAPHIRCQPAASPANLIVSLSIIVHLFMRYIPTATPTREMSVLNEWARPEQRHHFV